MATQLWAVGLVLLADLIGAFGPILLKMGSSRKLSSISSLITNYPLLGGIGLYAVGTVLFITALKGGELSVLYPLVALSYVWVSLLSVNFLGEKMNTIKWAGVITIIIGVTFLGFGSGG